MLAQFTKNGQLTVLYMDTNSWYQLPTYLVTDEDKGLPEGPKIW